MSTSQQAGRTAATQRAEPGVAVIPIVNWRGLATVYLKEVRRFCKVQLQTIWAPAVNTLLFLAIFTMAIDRGDRSVMGLPFHDFLAPGLIAMGMLQNSFANTSSSLLSAKLQGTIVDVLMPPLSPGELLFAYVAGAVTRAWFVGIVTFAAMLLWPSLHLSVANPLAILYFGTVGAAMLSLLGLLTGLWAEKFDHAAAVSNFVVQPLTLLSGTFYTIDRLREPWSTLSYLNPIFHVIDGFRHGFIGSSDGHLWTGAFLLLAVTALLLYACYRVLRTGWRIKA